jgi:uncharacterized repeat protein (TIGR02543 family)
MFVSAGALVLSSGQAQAADNTCVVDQSTIAQCFPDPALAQAVASGLGTHITTSNILTSTAVKYTTSLSVISGTVYSLKGVNSLTNLRWLWLNGSEVSDLSPVSTMTSLESLALEKNQISDLSPLKNLTNLRDLWLRSNRITDLTPLAGLPNLDSNLDLSDQYVSLPSVSGTKGVVIRTAKNVDGTYIAPYALQPSSGVYDAKTGEASWTNLTSGKTASLNVDTPVTIGSTSARYSLQIDQPYTLSANVSFDANGGKFADKSTLQTKAATVGSGYVFPQEPSRQGYSFDGWYTSAEGGTQVNSWDTVPDSSSRTLYAHWSVKPIAVTFDANGGAFSNGASAQENDIKPGSKYVLPPNPSRVGYSFDGWYTKAVGGNKLDGSATIPSNVDSQTFYAHWAANSVVVMFDANGGAFSNGSSSQKLNSTFGKPYTLPANPTRAGYSFAGWYTGKDDFWPGNQITAASVVSDVSDQTLYAHWDVQPVNVSFDANGGKFSDGSGLQKRTMTLNEWYDLPENPSRIGYSFNGWYTAKSGGTQVDAFTTVTATSSRALYAQWTANSVTVTFDTNGGTFPNGAPTQINDQKFGDAYSLPSNPTRTGYTFNGWYTAKTGGNKITASATIAAAGNQTLYAQWTENKAVPVAVYRVYNKNSGLHHYTTNLGEKNALVKLGWKYEGVSFNAATQGSAPGLKPVYREYNPHDGNHNWTLNQAEHSKLVSLGWHDEGVAWYANPAGPVTVYRLYNPHSGEHVYTTSAKEYAVVGAAGWHQEGTAWKGL